MPSVVSWRINIAKYHASGSNRSFAIFFLEPGNVPFDPAHNRVIVRFKDSKRSDPRRQQCASKNDTKLNQMDDAEITEIC